MPFEFERFKLTGIVLIKPKCFGDDRGFFMETFKKSDFESEGLPIEFAQDNHSSSKAYVLRGLHYQLPPNAQGKMIRVTSGRLFDVVVDIRKNSPTFGEFLTFELSAQNKHILWVPVGFAHGVLTLEDNTHLLYKCTAEYSPAHERSILWNDPAINIPWPLIGGVMPTLTEKDAKGVLLEGAELF